MRRRNRIMPVSPASRRIRTPLSRNVFSTVLFSCLNVASLVAPESVIQTFGVALSIRSMSRSVGSTPRPRRQGARTATGSSSSICSHTAGSSAFEEPWCGILYTEALPDGRSVSPRITTQPFLSKSAPRRSVLPLHSTHSATATSFGEKLRIRFLFPPRPGINPPTDARNCWNAPSPGESDDMVHPPLRNTTRLARACIGIFLTSPN